MFRRRHLLTCEGLTTQEIIWLLDLADGYTAREEYTGVLRGRTLMPLFDVPSPTLLASFEQAAKRLGAGIADIGSTAAHHGLSLIETATFLNAVRPDFLVVRHRCAGAAELISHNLDCAIINAGDGAHQHPAQALHDALTIRRMMGRVESLVVAICADFIHSSAAHSNIDVLNALGARIRLIAPSTLLPPNATRYGEVFTDMRAGVKDADVILMLDVEPERMQGSEIPSPAEYRHFFRLDDDKLGKTKPDALVLQNRVDGDDTATGSTVSRDATCDAHARLETGVAVRMAVLEALAAAMPSP